MYLEERTTSLMSTYFQAMGLLVVIVFLCGFSLPHTDGDTSPSDNDSVRYYAYGTIADSGFFDRDSILWYKYNVHEDISLDMFNDHRFVFHYVSKVDTSSSMDWSTGVYTIRITSSEGKLDGIWENGASSSDSILLKLWNGVTHQYKVDEDEDCVLWKK